jgi:hypothetical protein
MSFNMSIINAPFKACLGESDQEDPPSIGAPVTNKIAITKQIMKHHTSECVLLKISFL